MSWVKWTLFSVALTVIFAIATFAVAGGRWMTEEKNLPPVYPSNPPPLSSITINGQIPYWMGFYARPLWDRYPLYYCLDGAGWSQADRDAAYDGLTTAWGWGKVNRTVLTQIQERCDEQGPPGQLPARVTVRFVMDSAFVQNSCQPGTPFTVVACVTFDDWEWLNDAQAWSYGVATVHVEPYYWALMDHNWREHVFIHEFGHAGLSLNDTPAQACGVTVMDYTYEPNCGMLPYPSGLDIAVVNTLHGGYKDAAWWKWERGLR